MTDTSYRANPVAHGDFRVGAVLSRSMSILQRNFPAFFLLMLVASLPNLFVSGPLAPRDPVTLGITASAAGLLVLLLSGVGQAVILYATVQDMRGRPPALGDMLAKGFSRILALIGLGIVVILAMLVGLVVMLVPTLLVTASSAQVGLASGLVVGADMLAIFIAFWAVVLMWFVALPACVVERLGPFRSLGRSRWLTKGYRWRILGLLLLVMLAAIVVGAVFFLLIFALDAFVGSESAEALANVIWGGLAGAFYAVVLAVTYHDLRVAKEGVDAEQIAAVFD
jgi:hypothetical protein